MILPPSRVQLSAFRFEKSAPGRPKTPRPACAGARILPGASISPGGSLRAPGGGVLFQFTRGAAPTEERNQAREGTSRNPKPICSKCASPVNTSAMPRSCITIMEVKSTNEMSGLSPYFCRTCQARRN